MKTLADAKQFLQDNHVKYILAQFVDIHGVAKVKSVPAAHLEDILTTGAGFAGGAIWGMGIEPNGPDYMAVGELSTLSLIPWQPGYARIICDGHVNGAPYEYDSRVVLKKQVARLQQHGWTLNTGLEPEFSLLRMDEQGRIQPSEESDTLQKPCYDYKGITRNAPYLEKLTEALIAVGLDVYQVDHEDANGQFEFDFQYSDALTTCDRLTFFRFMAKHYAREQGLLATMMPKPFADKTGNGAHFNMSLYDLATGDNLFACDPKDDPYGIGLSRLGYQFVAGILRHGRALCAVFAPTVNSYKRLVRRGAMSYYSWAPVFNSWGSNNRTNSVRIPAGGGRCESRNADGSVNPYLAATLALAAGLEGIREGLDPGSPNDDNLYAISDDERRARGIDFLPQTLQEAVAAFAADPLVTSVLGAGLRDEFIRYKSEEWEAYHLSISRWETERYSYLF